MFEQILHLIRRGGKNEIKTLIYNKDGGIGTITLNRPNAMNALNNELLNELSLLLDEIGIDDGIKR